MARCAVVNQQNIVVNIIVAEPGVDPAPEGFTFIETDLAGPGWVWDGNIFTNPNPPSTPSTIVPVSITRRQCALQLFAIGQITSQETLDMTKTATVPAAISAVFGAQVTSGAWTAEQRTFAEIDFAATNYYRNNSLLSLMGLTEEQIDQFFIAAALL
jgi:hypothetical protein